MSRSPEKRWKTVRAQQGQKNQGTGKGSMQENLLAIFWCFYGVNRVKTQHKEHQSCIGRGPGGCVTRSAFQVGSRPGLQARGLRAEGMRLCTSGRAAHKRSCLIFIGALRAAGVNAGTVHLVCGFSRRLSSCFLPLGDPATSRSFILLRFICANGGQSGVPLPRHPASRVCFSLLVLCAAGWLAACHQDQSRSLTHHHSSC